MSTEAEHYRSREQQERAMAAASVDPRIAAIHVAMANHYASSADISRSSKKGTGTTPLSVAGGDLQTVGG